jgi:quercetin dioxygenase-like cupin family protein
MRSYIAGVDGSGRSCIVQEIDVEKRDLYTPGRSHRTGIYELRETPPPPRPATRAPLHETGLEPGHMDVCVLQMPAGVEHPVHYTDTLNLHVINAGSVEVLLDDGPHLLNTGDSLVMPGIDHGWRAGPDGCIQTIMNLGSTKP